MVISGSSCIKKTLELGDKIFENSDLRTVSYGVPQGSTLGPLFFLFYINNLYRSIACNNVRLYADETAIITNNHDLNYAQEQVKELFTKLYHWWIANYQLKMIKPILYCSIWKTRLFPGILPVSQ